MLRARGEWGPKSNTQTAFNERSKLNMMVRLCCFEDYMKMYQNNNART